MPARASYAPPSAETVLDYSDDERAKHQATVDPGASPNTAAKKLSKRRDKEKEDVVPSSSRSSGERRRRHSFRGPERPERTQPSPTPKPASLKQSKIRQVFTYNFSELQSEVGGKTPRPDRVAEVKARDLISQHRRTASTSSLKTAYVASADNRNDKTATDGSRIAKKSSSTMQNNSDHLRSNSTTSPSVMSSACSSVSSATTNSNNSSGSNSTVTQESVVSGTLRRSERSINDLIRQPNGNLTPRAQEVSPSSNDAPDVFAFQDDSSETASLYPSDITGTTVDQLPTSLRSSHYPTSRNSESNSSRPLNNNNNPPQSRTHRSIGPDYWAQQEWLRQQAEQRSTGTKPLTPTVTLRSPENIASSVKRSSVGPEGRDSPTGSTSSGTRSNSTSGMVGDTDTARSSSPERSSKGDDTDPENRKHTPKEKVSTKTAFEPILTRQRERAATVNTHLSSRPRPDPKSKVNVTPRVASGSLPSREITSSDAAAISINENPRVSPQVRRGSMSTSATADTFVTAKTQPSESTPSTGNRHSKQKILPISAIQTPVKLNSRETSPERFYRPPDPSPRMLHKQVPRNPPPQYQAAPDGREHHTPDIKHLYPQPPQTFYPVSFDPQTGFSAPFAPPTPDFLQMPGMMLPGRYPSTPIPPYGTPPSPIPFRSSTPFNPSKPSTSNYDLLASHLSNTTDKVTPLYRRFAFLNHRILLHLQSELADLEEELRRLDATASGTGPTSCLRINPELEFQRIEILGQVFVKIGQYNQALTSFSTIASQSGATPHLIQSYKRFLTTHTPNTSHSFLAEPADLLAVTSNPPLPSSLPDTPENYTPILLLLAAVAILVPVLAFGVIPNWLGRMAFVGVVAGASAVVLRDKEGEAGVLGDGWERGVVVAGYVGIMGVLAGVVA